jgi:hypothetical protein
MRAASWSYGMHSETGDRAAEALHARVVSNDAVACGRNAEPRGSSTRVRLGGALVVGQLSTARRWMALLQLVGAASSDSGWLTAARSCGFRCNHYVKNLNRRYGSKAEI